MTRRQPRASWPAKVDLLERLVDPRLEGAKCTGRAPLHDFEIDGETPAERSKRLAYARRLCEQCPVRSMCRTAATEQQHPAGMWGGRLRNRRQEAA